MKLLPALEVHEFQANHSDYISKQKKQQLARELELSYTAEIQRYCVSQ